MNLSETSATFSQNISTPPSFTNASMLIADSSSRPLLSKLDQARVIVAVLGILAFTVAFLLVCCRWWCRYARKRLRGPPPEPEEFELNTQSLILMVPEPALPKVRLGEGKSEPGEDTLGEVSSIGSSLPELSVSPFHVSLTPPTPTAPPSPATNSQSEFLLPVEPASLRPRTISPQKSSSSGERQPLLSVDGLAERSESPRRFEPPASVTSGSRSDSTEPSEESLAKKTV